MNEPSSTPSDPPSEAHERPPAVPEDSSKPAWRLICLDVLVFAILVALCIPHFARFTHGDFFGDEADYARAGGFGIAVNRVDGEVDRNLPGELIRSRHFHAPLTAEVLSAAEQYTVDDRGLRMPFVFAGALTIGLTYLCGVVLFEGRREIAVACAGVLAAAPAFERMASHALPWALIIAETMLTIWCAVKFAQTRRPGWLAGGCGAMGLLFVTSETFFVALLALLCCAPLLWLRWPGSGVGGAAGSAARAAAIGLALGIPLFVGVAFVLWPAGLRGDAFMMLRHYVEMRHLEFPVNIGPAIYENAPRWAYAYWYWFDYRPFFVLYVAGALAAALLALLRRHSPGTGVLAIFTAVYLASAHKAHIIGPEYLAHCLPMLSLLAGYTFLALGRAGRLLSIAMLLIAAVVIARWRPHKSLPGMDIRAQVSRWPSAARAISRLYHPGDRMIAGPQPAPSARWYIRQVGRVDIPEHRISQMPIRDPSPAFLAKLSSGYLQFVILYDTIQDTVDLDPATYRILSGWRVVYRSDEHGTGLPRLTVYEYPE